MDRRSLTTEEFIRRAEIVHGAGKYDYSKVNYINKHILVNICCPIHGIFNQRTQGHLKGQGCPRCAVLARVEKHRITTNEFILRAKLAYRGNMYDYSATTYTGAADRVSITCHKHGQFLRLPREVYLGYGCQICKEESFLKKKQSLFIDRAKKIHGNKYNYDKVRYKCSKSKVCIVCDTHGDFFQEPTSHLAGCGCRLCGISKRVKSVRLTTKEFVDRAISIHGTTYNYDKVNYTGINVPVTITCVIHGDFQQLPSVHLIGCGCQICSVERDSKRKLSTTESFIEKARECHNELYDYSRVKYKNNVFPVEIICSKHGLFSQSPNAHLHSVGCPKCGRERGRKRKMTTEDFIKKAEDRYGKGKYDYSKSKYVSSHNSLIIVCKKHGEFSRTATDHLSGIACHKCITYAKKSTETFIKEAIAIHGLKYDYTKTIYTYARKKLGIVCPKHGEFLQYPYTHLTGAGCPICSSSKGELKIKSWLDKNNILYDTEKRFNGCRNILPLSFDFYLPRQNMCIEYDGEQHFRRVAFRVGKYTDLAKIKIMDNIKNKYCLNNNIRLLRIPYTSFNDVDRILKNNVF